MELTDNQLLSLSIKIYESDDKKLTPLIQTYLIPIIGCLDKMNSRKESLSLLTHIKQRVENNNV